MNDGFTLKFVRTLESLVQMLHCLFSEPDLLGAGSLLRKYLSLICGHVSDVMPVACALAVYSSKHFTTVARIITSDVTGKIGNMKSLNPDHLQPGLLPKMIA